MKLIICEKPSVGVAISSALGVKNRRDGYFESSNHIVSCVLSANKFARHLAELASADVYDARFAKWRYNDLPIIPEKWEYTLKDGKSKQFKLLRDHHAIVPTPSLRNADISSLPSGEREVLRLVARQLLCAVGEPFRFAETRGKVRMNGLYSQKMGRNYDATVVLDDDGEAVPFKLEFDGGSNAE